MFKPKDKVAYKELVSDILKKTTWNSTVLGICTMRGSYSKDTVYIIFIDNKLFIINEKIEYDVVPIKYIRMDDGWYGNCLDLRIYEAEFEDSKIINSLNEVNLNYSQSSIFLKHVNRLDELKDKFLNECKKLKEEKYPLIKDYIKSYFKNYMQDDFNFEKYNIAYNENLSEFELDKRYVWEGLPYNFDDFLLIIKEKGNFNESHNKFFRLAVLMCFKEVIINNHANKFYSFFEDPSLLNIGTVEELIDIARKNPLWSTDESGKLWHLICFYFQSRGIAKDAKNEEIIALYEWAYKYFEGELKNQDLLNLKNELERQFTDMTVQNMVTIDDTDLMSGVEFENFVALLFEKMGYFISTTVATGDQGVDLIAIRNNIKIGIQVKRYSDKVTNKAVQEVVAGIAHYKLNKGMVVTNNYYTSSAKELANSNDIVLWDREMLKIKIKELS